MRRWIVPIALAIASSGALSAPVAAATSGGWSNLGTAGSGVPGLNGPVLTMHRVGTKLYVGGAFTNAGGVAAADYLAVWNGSTWSAVGAGLTGQVESIAVDGSTVYVGGSILNASGNANADHLVRWTGSAWAPVGGATFNDAARAMLVVDGDLYVGGAFTDADGIAEADSVAAFDLTGATGWRAITPAGPGIGAIRTMDADGSGTLYVGGSFNDGLGVAAMDAVAAYDTASGDWSALGSGALNATVIDLAVDGSGVYVAGDFYDAAGIESADKVAYWNGATWEALGGGGGGLGEEDYVHGNALMVDDGAVFLGGYFFDAGGNARADHIAVLRGGTWRNVGSDGGAGAPTQHPFYALSAYRNLLVGGGASNVIGGGALNAYVASYLLRQPDASIALGTGSFVGGNVYNATAKKQSVSTTVAAGKARSFSVRVQNDGALVDSITVKGPGSANGFTLTYLDGSTNVTADVVAGTYELSNLAPGATRTLTMKIKAGAGVGAGTSKAFLVKATSTGLGTAQDAVKAVLKVS